MNAPIPSPTYDLEYEVARAIGFALNLAGRPKARPRRHHIVKAIASAFAIDDLVLVGTLHMLSQIDVYTAALRNEGPEAATPGTTVIVIPGTIPLPEPFDQGVREHGTANDDQEAAHRDRP